MVARLKTNLHIRVMHREMRSWRKAARREGETLSEWIRTRLNLVAVPPPPPALQTVSGDQIELPLLNKDLGSLASPRISK